MTLRPGTVPESLARTRPLIRAGLEDAVNRLAPSLSQNTTSVAGTGLTIAQLLQQYYFTSDPSGPRCAAQGPLGSLTTGQVQSFPHLQPLP